MKRGHKIYPFIWFFVLGLSLLLGQQNSSYLTQKLMVESDLRSRIASALSKIIDDQKYVIDVDVDIEVTGEKEEQITIIPSDRPIYDEASALEELTTIIGEAAPKDGSDPQSEFSSMGLPIPGFDFEVEAEPQVAQESSDGGQQGPGMGVPIQEPGNTTERVQSKTLTKRVPAIAAVKRLQISIILQEGAAPELIENIRQVVMVASRFDRSRGDVLSIMTATFKERRDEKSAEQVLLKSIADKLEMLQSGEDDALSKSIEKEISGALVELKEQLNNLERRSAADKFEYERKTALLRDSLQLRAIKEAITSLKNELSYANDARVDSQLTNRIAMLDSVQLGLEQEMNNVESSSALIILVSILGALVVVLLVLVIILLFKKKQGPQQPAMPMPWPYPPPMRKKKRKNRPLAKNANEEPKEDTDVIRGEIGEMRQSVVSMSVGQPKTATRIVKEWLEDDVVPEPEPEAPPEPEEDDSDKKKKKKK